MAITLSGSPQTLHAGYNPAYFYANSTNVNEPSFRYLVDITNQDSGDVLANLKIKPRYGDGLLEVNIQKILASDLSSIVDDIIGNSITSIGFINTDHTGFEYGIEFGEEYYKSWEFGDVIFNSGTVRLTGTTNSGYVAGDQINVFGAAEAFVFTDNQFDAGSLAFLIPTGHTINSGDTITVFQNAGYTYEQYNGNATVTNTTATLVTTDKTFAGATPIEGGVLYRNYNYDGLQLVTSAGTLGGGIYFVDIDESWVDNSPTHTGYTKYYDGRLFQDPALEKEINYVWYGAQTLKQFLQWDYTDYNPSGAGMKFLTNAPADYPIMLDNVAILIYWGNNISNASYKLKIKTYDSSDVLLGEYQIINPSNNVGQSQFLGIGVGPSNLNGNMTTISGSTSGITCDAAYYTVGVETLFSVAQSDLFTFVLDCGCNGRYDNYPITFVDRYGSVLPINFKLNHKESVNISREMYSKFVGGLSTSITPDGYTFNLAEHSTKPFNTTLMEEWELNTDWLSDDMVGYIEELFSSPLAWLKVDGTYYSINIMEKSFERVRRNNKKNIRYTIKVQFSLNNPVQTG
jgi:hypothetical protein